MLEGSKYLIKCELCANWFEKITGSHLWYAHNSSLDEYIARFPNAPLISIAMRQAILGQGNPNYGKTKQAKVLDSRLDTIDKEKLKDLVLQGKSSKEIALALSIARVTVVKLIEQWFPSLFKDWIVLDLSIRLDNRRKAGKLRKGVPSKLKGRSYTDILGSETRAKARAKITSDWMKTDKNIRRFITHPSKPQRELFTLVKTFLPEVVEEYPVTVSFRGYSRTIYLDIAELNQKLDIEYDGKHWHRDKEVDQVRDEVLKYLGWKVFRFRKEDLKDSETLRSILLNSR